MIIFRSFMKQVLKTAFATTVIIVGLFLVLRGMIFLGQAADGLIPVVAVFKLVSLAMLANLDVILPLMFYIALLMVFNRWYNDREMMVLASVGIGPEGFLKPLFTLNIFVVALVALLSFWVTPTALSKGYAVEQHYRESNEVSGLQTGRFVEVRNGKATYFIEAYNSNNNMYENVFVNQSNVDVQGSVREGVVRAHSAYTEIDQKTHSQFLILLDGSRYEGIAGSADYNLVEFKRYALRIDPPDGLVRYQPPKSKSTLELWNATDVSYRGELTWRMAKIFVFPVLSLFALAFSHVDTRGKKGGGTIAAFLVYLVYSNLLGYSVALYKRGDVESSSIVWAVHISFALMGCLSLYMRNENLSMRSVSTRLIPKLV